MSSDSRVRKVLWLAALVTLTYYTVSETTAILREYFAYSVAVAYEYDTNETLVFPDVTICNVNPLRRSRLCGMSAEDRDMNPDLEARLCGDPVPVFKDANINDLYLQQNLSAWAASRELKNGTWLMGMAHQFADTIVDCSYADWDCNDKKYFPATFDARHGACFCFHCGMSAMGAYAYGSLSSPHNGLVITLNAQLEEYLPTSYQAGFLVMIHSHGTRQVFGVQRRSVRDSRASHLRRPECDCPDGTAGTLCQPLSERLA
ncbi:unnamed protein product [Ixodes hexagonus]